MSPDNPPQAFTSRQITRLNGIFFLSGTAGLVFELLWFRLAALSLGNSVWAATAVLTAFMAGLALGNGLATLMSSRIRQPLRIYARVEFIVAATGLLLVFLLPNLGVLIATPSRELLLAGGGWPLHGLRLMIAFSLMLIPATAMGLTLPLLVRSLQTQDPGGISISRLYGWNTAGAVTGVLLAETLLIAFFGITGSACVASLLCVIAALLAQQLNRPMSVSRAGKFSLSLRYALAAILAGSIMLGLEVIWFRLLLLELRGTDRSFAYMLAMVLSSLANGSLLANLWLKRHAASRQIIIGLALASALLVPLSYWALGLPGNIWLRAALMIMPTASLSGALLPILATCLAQQNRHPATSTGWLWLANTAGGALGAALAGLVLLPSFGMENSLLILGLSYTAIVLCLWPDTHRRATLAGMAILAVVYLLLPRGLTEAQLESATTVYRQLDGSSVIRSREGVNETVQLLERRKFGQPYSFRLITDGYSMSGTERDSQRYMKLFAWLPQSLHPMPQEALLISYGVGSTATALLQDSRLSQLNIVDLSPDVLAMSPLIHGEQDDPLTDTRTKVYIEDGRQFLLVSEKQFDIITAEPPPPRMKGIVNLYTREYFQLINQHLKPGGYSSYWLPVDQLTLESSHAILAAFCAVFQDCSLWAGSNYNWIMLGSKGANHHIEDTQLAVLWQMPENQTDLAALGLEQPAMLGSAFLADADQLKEWYAGSNPLTDRWPRRLQQTAASTIDIQTYADWADHQQASKRFASSQWVRLHFPGSYRAAALQYYDLQPILNNEIPADPAANLPMVHRLLTTTDLQTPVYWLLDSEIAEQQLIDSLLDSGYEPAFAYPLGVRALAGNNFSAASSLFSEALQAGEQRAFGPAVYSLCREGKVGAARHLSSQVNLTLPFKCWNPG